MGYTHYWEIRPNHPDWRPGFAQLQLDAKRIIEHCRSYGIRVERIEYNWDVGQDSPDFMKISKRNVLEEGEILLNGWPGPQSHEDLYLHVDPASQFGDGPYGRYHREHLQKTGISSAFCKTARKPYDDVVATILLRGAVLLGDAFEIDSDGRWDADWLAGASDPALGPRVIYDYLFGDCPEVSPLQRDREAA